MVIADGLTFEAVVEAKLLVLVVAVEMAIELVSPVEIVQNEKA